MSPARFGGAGAVVAAVLVAAVRVCAAESEGLLRRRAWRARESGVLSVGRIIVVVGGFGVSGAKRRFNVLCGICGICGKMLHCCYDFICTFQ